jgi:hypothetical protein
MGEDRIQTGPLRIQIHMCVDKLDEVREAGTDGEESTPQKIMFDMVDEEFEGAMDDEKVWDSIPKEVRGEPWTRRIYQFNNDEHDAKLFFTMMSIHRCGDKVKWAFVEKKRDARPIERAIGHKWAQIKAAAKLAARAIRAALRLSPSNTRVPPREVPGTASADRGATGGRNSQQERK